MSTEQQSSSNLRNDKEYRITRMQVMGTIIVAAIPIVFPGLLQWIGNFFTGPGTMSQQTAKTLVAPMNLGNRIDIDEPKVSSSPMPNIAEFYIGKESNIYLVDPYKPFRAIESNGHAAEVEQCQQLLASAPPKTGPYLGLKVGGQFCIQGDRGVGLITLQNVTGGNFELKLEYRKTQ